MKNEKEKNTWSVTIAFWVVATIAFIINPIWYRGCISLILGLSLTIKSFRKDFRQSRSQNETYIAGVIISAVFAIIITILTISKIYSEYHWINGSAKEEMLQQIEEVEGECYNGKCVATQMVDQVKIQILEDMRVEFSVDKIRPWNDSMPDADKDGIPLSKANMISVFECKVDIVRYATVDGVIVPDSETHKYITYTAYEDRDLNSEAGTLVDLTTRKLTYSKTQDYFEDVEALIENASITSSRN